MFEALTSLMLADNKEAKDKPKDETYLITYTRHLEKKLRKLEKENLRLENQVRLEKREK